MNFPKSVEMMKDYAKFRRDMQEQPECHYFELGFSHIHSQLKKMRTAMMCPES